MVTFHRATWFYSAVWCVSVLASFCLIAKYCVPIYVGDDPSYVHIARMISGHPLEWLSPWRQFGWSYRPVFDEYFYGIYALGRGRPGAFFAFALFLHGSITFLTAWLYYRMTHRRLESWIVLVLVLLCPRDKWEAIWWISSESTLLAAIFMVLCLHFWLSWRRSKRVAWYVWALVSYVLAFGSKQDAYALFPIVPLFDILICPSADERNSWRIKLLTWLPPFAIFLFDTLANLISGRNSHIGNVVAAGHAMTQPLARLNTVQWFIRGGCPIMDVSLGTVAFLAILASLLILARMDKILLFLELAVLASDFPSPFGAGPHALVYGRFYYIPAIFLFMSAVYLWRHLLKLKAFGALIIAGLSASAIRYTYPFILPDPGDLAVDLLMGAAIIVSTMLTMAVLDVVATKDPRHPLVVAKSFLRWTGISQHARDAMHISGWDLVAGTTVLTLVIWDRVDTLTWTLILFSIYLASRFPRPNLPARRRGAVPSSPRLKPTMGRPVSVGPLAKNQRPTWRHASIPRFERVTGPGANQIFLVLAGKPR